MQENCGLLVMRIICIFSKDNSSFNVFRDANGKEIFKGLVINTCVEGLHNCLYVGTSKGLIEVNLTSRKVKKIVG